MAVEQRQLLQGGAAVLVLVFAAWSLWPAAAPPAVIAANTARPRPTKDDQEKPKPVAPVKLPSLTAPREAPGQAPRNPFRFQPRVVAPPPRPVAPPVTEAPRPAPIVPAGPPPAPPIPLKLIGVVERANGVKWAVLTDGKSAPMFGKDGDIIDGRYTIVKIGTESIEMTHTDGRGRQVIRLTGQ